MLMVTFTGRKCTVRPADLMRGGPTKRPRCNTCLKISASGANLFRKLVLRENDLRIHVSVVNVWLTLLSVLVSESLTISTYPSLVSVIKSVGGHFLRRAREVPICDFDSSPRTPSYIDMHWWYWSLFLAWFLSSFLYALYWLSFLAWFLSSFSSLISIRGSSYWQIIFFDYNYAYTVFPAFILHSPTIGQKLLA